MTLLATVLSIIYVVCCIALILFVLVQSGKGNDLGAMFGGGSQTVFGQDAGNFMTKTTTVLAVVYMVLALVLAKIISSPTAMLRDSDLGKNSQQQTGAPPAPEEEAAQETAEPGTEQGVPSTVSEGQPPGQAAAGQAAPGQAAPAEPASAPSAEGPESPEE